jgi:hypothetical protein
MGMPSRSRQVLQTDRLVVAPVCHDPLTARLVEALGFKAAYRGRTHHLHRGDGDEDSRRWWPSKL